MEIHGFPCSKNLGKTNKNRTENLGIQKMLKFKFMHFLESLDSRGNGKCNRGTVRNSYHETKHVEKWKKNSRGMEENNENVRNHNFQKVVISQVRLALEKMTFEK